ncbi:hypothetical protein [Aneurinibacillus uraniidurans]|uniref:hypothetical protein n=1 Tax=Aneurinibacillus uraniidurans TaxID=2966586 RepID=UPI00234B4657|nr:hypothetical protein [Aneurinibacillus sp. B1]WCN36669.1 hypothetical protein PO771_12400 [Aneurinibacillus sp. B1]
MEGLRAKARWPISFRWGKSVQTLSCFSLLSLPTMFRFTKTKLRVYGKAVLKSVLDE